MLAPLLLGEIATVQSLETQSEQWARSLYRTAHKIKSIREPPRLLSFRTVLGPRLAKQKVVHERPFPFRIVLDLGLTLPKKGRKLFFPWFWLSRRIFRSVGGLWGGIWQTQLTVWWEMKGQGGKTRFAEDLLSRAMSGKRRKQV